jgi:two-component system response regulator MtrA
MAIGIPTKLLVLDQDALGESFLKHILLPFGYEIYSVSSSAEGLLTSRSWNPDVIIINVMQPSDDGWKLCRRLREYSQAPILVLAAISDPLSIAHWLDAGADDYLTRPFSAEILVAHLQKITRRMGYTQNLAPLTFIH